MVLMMVKVTIKVRWIMDNIGFLHFGFWITATLTNYILTCFTVYTIFAHDPPETA